MIEVSPSLFFKHAKSPHWIWYDLFGDPSLQTEMPELTKRLIEDGVLHEEEYVQNLKKITVDPKLSEIISEQHTLEHMRAGEDLIYQGVIAYIDGEIRYKGRPDLLKKCDGTSELGDYYYIPVEIKNSTKCDKAEYKKQLMLYAMILEKVQGIRPTYGEFINKKHETVTCELDSKLYEKTVIAIGNILQILRGSEPPLKVTSTSKQTPWFDALLNEAKIKNDIALIYDLDSKVLDGLRQVGINNLQDMVSCSVDALPKIKWAGIDTLKRAHIQANALIKNEIIKLSKPDIPDAQTKIYFDIEGDPFLGVQYLFGLWIVRSNSTPIFKYFLAEKPEDEESMWNNFIDWLKTEQFNDCKIYHYHDYEKQHLNKLSKKYGGSNNLDVFISNLVDLLKITTESYIFPVYFYSIKDIAKYLDFKWQHEKAGGAQSIFWYEQWLESGDRSVLQDIINYNEDDVRATEFLHRWLVSN